MSRIGFIGYKNHSGLGTAAANFRKHLPLDSQFIIRHPVKDAPGEEYNIGISHEYGDLEPTVNQFIAYLDKCIPEVVIIVETPFNFEFFKILYDRGIKVVLIPMIDSIAAEKFYLYEEYIDLIINVTKIGHTIYVEKWAGKNVNCVHIPYPVDTNYFNPFEAVKSRDNRPTAPLVDGVISTSKTMLDEDVAEAIRHKQDTFLHSAGFGGAGVRKGSDLVQNAFRQLEFLPECKGKVSIRIHSQKGELEHNPLRFPQGEEYIQLVDVPEAINLYRNGRIYLAPSRREGLGLPILEAMSCGLPVITTNAPPMNSWFPDDYPLLIQVQSQTELPYGDIPMYTPMAYDLMQKMKFAYDNPTLMDQLGKANRIIIQEKFSWDVLKDTYLKVLNT